MTYKTPREEPMTPYPWTILGRPLAGLDETNLNSFILIQCFYWESNRPADPKLDRKLYAHSNFTVSIQGIQWQHITGSSTSEGLQNTAIYIFTPYFNISGEINSGL